MFTCRNTIVTITAYNVGLKLHVLKHHRLTLEFLMGTQLTKVLDSVQM